MTNNKRKFVVCTLLMILALFIFTFTGCAEKSNDSINQASTALVAEKAQDNLEQLKLERGNVLKSLKEAETEKLKSNKLTGKEKEEALKKLEESEKQLIEQSKEIEEKIKALQGSVD